MFGLTRYQWTVLFAAWLGWGFDVFDGLLFNYVAPNCVPTLLGLADRHAGGEASATLLWTGLLTSLLLLGWAAGGDPVRQASPIGIGRTRTLLLTMAALLARHRGLRVRAEHLGAASLFRLVASLGIGGEWAAGASMVAEIVPEERRVEAGALLYTSAPLGLFLATFVNTQVAGRLVRGRRRETVVALSCSCPGSSRPRSRSWCACSSRSPSAGSSAACTTRRRRASRELFAPTLRGDHALRAR